MASHDCQCRREQLHPHRRRRRQLSFDVIVIGAGPSAAGLLHGLLTRIIDGRRDDDDDDGKDPENSQFRIAVIERGTHRNDDTSVLLNDDDFISNGASHEFADEFRRYGNDVNESTRNKSTSTSTSNLRATNKDADVKIIQTPVQSRFDHPHRMTHSLRHWFTAAHFTSRPTDRYGMLELEPSVGIGSGKPSSISLPPSPTMLHITTPQRYLNNRIIDVPTGTGWGGTTNINAGLVVEPWFGQESNEGTKRRGSTVNDAAINRALKFNEHVGGDFDAWPGQWKGGKIIKEAMREVLDAMRVNDSLRPNDFPSATCKLPPELDTTSTKHNPFHMLMQDTSHGEYGKFQPVVTSSTTMPACHLNTEENEIGEGLGHTESKRVNYFSSLIQPLMHKYPGLESCVKFISGVQVERILIDSEHGHGTPRAWGVEVTSLTSTSDRRRFIIESSQEIIVCAGAIGSPSLLLASGIGRADDLMAGGITPWYDLPSNRDSRTNHEIHKNLPVGHNLRDHVILPRILVTPYRQEKSSLSNNSVRGSLYLDIAKNEILEDGATSALIELQLVDGIQMDSMITHAAAAALRRDWTLSIGNTKWKVPIAWITGLFDFVRFILNIIFSYRLFRVETRLRTASINVCLLNPQSTGKVHILSQRNKDGGEGLLPSPTRLSECRVQVDPGYLSNPCDVDALWMGWQASSRVKRRWFGNCRELLPGLLFIAVHYLVSSMTNLFRLLSGCVKGDLNDKQGVRPEWFSSYAAEFTNPYYHWCGTCAMGEEKTADLDVDAIEQFGFVVDEHLCVRGVACLRVCDASVFPGCISAPTALTCAALGRAASAVIKINP